MMSDEKQEISQKTLFHTKTVCPICEGRGVVECCNADGTDCVPVPCDRCNGGGFMVEKNVGTIVACAVGAVVLVIVALVVLL